MAYLRGDCYLFDSGEHFHIWVRGGYDAWRESGWAELSPQPERDSGVQVSIATMDQFVLMRLAVMVAEGTASTTLQEMVAEFSRSDKERGNVGNVGEDCLRQNHDLMRRLLRSLEEQFPRAHKDV